jgi:hypothetical protein
MGLLACFWAGSWTTAALFGAGYLLNQVRGFDDWMRDGSGSYSFHSLEFKGVAALLFAWMVCGPAVLLPFRADANVGRRWQVGAGVLYLVGLVLAGWLVFAGPYRAGTTLEGGMQQSAEVCGGVAVAGVALLALVLLRFPKRRPTE